MRISGNPFKVRLTRGSSESRPKVELTLKSNDQVLTFDLGETDAKQIGNEILGGKCTVECDKKPGFDFSQGLNSIFLSFLSNFYLRRSKCVAFVLTPDGGSD